MTVSLRGGAPRRPKKLPAALVHSATRHELPTPLANRSLCSALASMALHQELTRVIGTSSDPIVEYAGTRYRLVGDLVNGSLYDVTHYTRRFVINEGRLRAANTDVARQLPAIDAIARVSYVLEHGDGCDCRCCRIDRGRAAAGIERRLLDDWMAATTTSAPAAEDRSA